MAANAARTSVGAQVRPGTSPAQGGSNADSLSNAPTLSRPLSPKRTLSSHDMADMEPPMQRLRLDDGGHDTNPRARAQMFARPSYAGLQRNGESSRSVTGSGMLDITVNSGRDSDAVSNTTTSGGAGAFKRLFRRTSISVKSHFKPRQTDRLSRDTPARDDSSLSVSQATASSSSLSSSADIPINHETPRRPTKRSFSSFTKHISSTRNRRHAVSNASGEEGRWNISTPPLSSSYVLPPDTSTSLADNIAGRPGQAARASAAMQNLQNQTRKGGLPRNNMRMSRTPTGRQNCPSAQANCESGVFMESRASVDSLDLTDAPIEFTRKGERFYHLCCFTPSQLIRPTHTKLYSAHVS
jgi:hypothetical protein